MKRIIDGSMDLGRGTSGFEKGVIYGVTLLILDLGGRYIGLLEAHTYLCPLPQSLS